MKVFLGYASEHEAQAREVYAHLKSLGHDVWFDKVSLIAGDDWDRERANAQRAAELVVHLCSKEIVTRTGVVNREIRTTLRLIEDQPFGALYVIFLRLEDFRLPAEFLQFQYIDYFKRDWKERLTEAVAKRVAQLAGAALALAEKDPSEKVSSPPVADPANVEFSQKTELYDLTGNYLRYAGSTLYWTFLNARIVAEALEGYVGTASQIAILAEEDQETIRERDTPYSWFTSTEEFFRKGDIVSIRSYSHTYMGGAHPNHHITTLNFLGEDHGFVPIEDLLQWEFTYAKKVLSYCRKVLEATFPGEIDENTFAEYQENKESTWDLLRQYGVDSKGITINFSPYDVLPYAFGIHEVLVPWSFIEDLIGENFKRVVERLR